MKRDPRLRRPSTPWSRARKFDVGELFELPASRTPDLPIRVDRRLELRPALGERFRLADVATLVRDVADQLAAAGVRRGDRLAVMKTPSLDVPVLEAAAARLGAVPALLWPDVDPPIAEELLRRLDRPVLVTDRAVRDAALAPLDLSALARMVVTVDDGALDVERHAPPGPATLPPEVVLVTHTSGTTGVPKLVGYPAVALGAHTQFQISIATALRLRGPVLFCVSLFHGRMTSALAAAFARRIPTAVLSEPTAETAEPILTELRPRIAESFPNAFLQWERLVDAPGSPLSSIGLYVNTFDAVHPRTVQRLLDASRGRLPVYMQVYGTTETGPLTVRVHTRATASRADGRCVGYPFPGFTRVRIRPTNGDGRRGEIEVRALGAARTYVGETERHAPGSSSAWWRSGDLGTRGRWGCLHLLDRVVDESPQLASNLAIEDRVLTRMPSLTEVVVVPVEDGGPPVPIVCTGADARLDRNAWARATAGLPELAEPIHVAWSAVPRTSTWKVRRLELRRRLAAGELEPISHPEAVA